MNLGIIILLGTAVITMIVYFIVRRDLRGYLKKVRSKTSTIEDSKQEDTESVRAGRSRRKKRESSRTRRR